MDTMKTLIIILATITTLIVAFGQTPKTDIEFQYPIIFTK